MPEVRQPMFISARLMAALKIEDAGTIHVHALRRERDNRVLYGYIIDDVDGTQLHVGTDLHSGSGDAIDYAKAMSTLLSFLSAAAEAVDYKMRTGNDSENGDLFPEPVMEWCHRNSDALATYAYELGEQ